MEKFNKFKKTYIILTVIAVILLSCVAVKRINQNNQISNESQLNENKTNEMIENAVSESSKVSYSSIEKLIEEQNNGDYSLETMLNIFKTNPAYIVEGDVCTTKAKEVSGLINDYINKKSYKDTVYVIELIWIAEDGKEISSYIATDITDKVNIIGVTLNDKELDLTQFKESNSNETTLSFNDLAKLNVTSTELMNKLKNITPYNYYKKYSLLWDSQVVKDNFTHDYATGVVTEGLVRTKDSTIIIGMLNDIVYSVEEVRDNDDFFKYDNATINEALSNENLTENEFKKTFKEATLTSIKQEIETNNMYNSYYIKNNDNEIFHATFINGLVSEFHSHSEEGHEH